ncbi:hypothetical protein CENSYa_0798 [Cenarchaeum symbiosum A]|uniref:Uncharacterized protein n=1 Tax=Cenarchaeum symbiosum (strain A) TaxID=414004 RepID=A0RVR4_CENSY|nr:hypothetical protein CENSYa_0798 [Cenarchaeum symbiosum A]
MGWSIDPRFVRDGGPYQRSPHNILQVHHTIHLHGKGTRLAVGSLCGADCAGPGHRGAPSIPPPGAYLVRRFNRRIQKWPAKGRSPKTCPPSGPKDSDRVGQATGAGDVLDRCLRPRTGPRANSPCPPPGHG